MTNNDQLSERLTACVGFRWLPGMRYRLSTIDPDEWTVRVSDDPRQLAALNRVRLPDDAVLLPDLSDPATRGCVLQLVRDVWGAPDAHAVMHRHPDDGRPWWSIESFKRSPLCFFERLPASEAEALIAALDAAPAHAPTSDVSITGSETP